MDATLSAEDDQERRCVRLALVAFALEWALVLTMAATSDWQRLSVYFGG